MRLDRVDSGLTSELRLYRVYTVKCRYISGGGGGGVEMLNW